MGKAMRKGVVSRARLPSSAGAVMFGALVSDCDGFIPSQLRIKERTRSLLTASLASLWRLTVMRSSAKSAGFTFVGQAKPREAK